MLQGGPHGLSGHYECAKTHSLTQHVYEWTQARSRHHGIARLQVQVVLVCNSLALISSENRPRQSRHPIASHFIYLFISYACFCRRPEDVFNGQGGFSGTTPGNVPEPLVGGTKKGRGKRKSRVDRFEGDISNLTLMSPSNKNKGDHLDITK